MWDLGVQLYTVREYLKDARERQQTMEQIKAIGYTSVQLFGTAEQAQTCAEAAKTVGLTITGILADLEKYETELAKYVAIAKTYGIRDLGVSGFTTTLAGVKDYILKVNCIAKKIREYGLSFSYHNHAAEFIKLPDGRTIMEHYLEGFEKDLVDFMPDTYWIHCGGYDVRRFLEITKDRVQILHLKDMQYTGNGQTYAEIGSGNLYFEGILQLAQENGIAHLVVEQDRCAGDPIDSLKRSYDYIQGLNIL